MNFGELINLWLDEKQAYSVKHRTFLRYKDLVRTQILPELGGVELNGISVKLLNDFQRAKFISGNRVTGKPLANNTVKNVMSLIRGCLEYGRTEKGLEFGKQKKCAV